jgi:hypothetical protein
MSSADHARKASISWDKWCRKMIAGDYPGQSYKRTEWYQAGLSLEAEVRTVPLEPIRHGNRCVYFSTVTDRAISFMSRLGPLYTALFSADLNESGPDGRYHVTDAQLAQLRGAGVTVASWCDCDATPYSAAVLMAHERGLAFAGGQAESDGQYLRATQGGARHLIGEPSDLSGDVLKDAIRRSYDGSLAFIGEVMHPDPTYSAQGVNITSACLYVDRDAAQGGYIPLDRYGGMPPSLRNGCSIFAGGRMTDADWQTYRAWTVMA